MIDPGCLPHKVRGLVEVQVAGDVNGGVFGPVAETDMAVEPSAGQRHDDHCHRVGVVERELRWGRARRPRLRCRGRAEIVLMAHEIPPMPWVSAIVWRTPNFSGRSKSIWVASFPPTWIVFIT